MNTFKNYVIALLIGLLALSLFTQPAQSAPVKTYDAVKVAEYSACLYFAMLKRRDLNLDYYVSDEINSCKYMRPK